MPTIDKKLFTKSKLYEYAIVVMAGAIPSGNIAITNLAIGLLFLAWLINLNKPNLRNSKPQIGAFILMLSLFLLYIISLSYTNNTSTGISQLEKHLSFIFFPLVLFIGPVIKVKTVKNAIIAFSAVCVFLLICCITYAIWDYWYTEELTLIIGPTIYNKFLYYGLTRIITGWHPVYVALYLVFIISFCWIQYISVREKRYLVTIAISVIFLGLLQSVASFLLLSVVTLYYVFFVMDTNKKTKVALTATLLLTISAVFFVNQKFYNKVKRALYEDIKPDDGSETRNSLTIRLAKWKSAISVIEDNIWIGVSPGDLEDELVKKYDQYGYKYLKKQKYNPHNQYLQILASFGIIGLTIFILLLLTTFQIAISSDHTLFTLLLIMLLVGFLSESTLQRHQGIVFFCFFVSLFSFQKKSDEKS